MRTDDVRQAYRPHPAGPSGDSDAHAPCDTRYYVPPHLYPPHLASYRPSSDSTAHAALRIVYRARPFLALVPRAGGNKR